MILFLTGASGVGKTTIVTKMENTYPELFDYYHFDDIGIPSAEEMALIENWQEKATHQWIEKLITDKSDKSTVFEGSTNGIHIKSGFEKFNYSDYKIVYIDCNEKDMITRLIERGQPELVTPDMKGWLNYLRNQAGEFGVEIINTSEHSIDEAIEKLLKMMG